MKKAYVIILLLFALFPTSITAHPLDVPLAGEYTINTQAINIGADSWRFIYTITNISEGTGPYTGLDGFYVMVPLTATISNIQVPAPYDAQGGAAYWTWFYEAAYPIIDTSTYKWLKFWGSSDGSVYPIATSAIFHFDASNVHVGANLGYVITYLDEGYKPDIANPNTWYHAYYSEITGPVPTGVPEPTTMLLLGLGLVGLAGIRRKVHK